MIYESFAFAVPTAQFGNFMMIIGHGSEKNMLREDAQENRRALTKAKKEHNLKNKQPIGS